MLKRGLLTGVLLVGLSGIAQAQTVADPSEGAAIAVYSDGLSVIREFREADLPGGPASIALPGLPQHLDRSSLNVRIGGEAVGSLRIRHDSLAPNNLLRRALGTEITWLVPVGESGAEREIRGTLINVDGGIVLQVGDRFEAMPPGRLALDRLPPGMTGGLEVTAIADAVAGAQPVEIRYVTPNLSWSADYEAALLPDSDGLILSGHYEITNNTDTGYDGTVVRLVAGGANRVPPPPPPPPGVMERAAPAMTMMAEDAVVAPPRESSLGDVHVYDIAGRVDLPEGETVRRVLLEPITVPAEKTYRIQGSGLVYPGQVLTVQDGLRPEVALSFDNTAGGPLARALPAGPVRVFGALAEDGETAPSVILGEDWIDHIPVGATVELNLGQAFDVTLERQVLDYETTGVAQHRHLYPYRATHEITFRNGRDEPVEVELTELLQAQRWEIVDASFEPERRDAASALWTIPIPAKGETVLRYTVKVKP